MAKGAFTLHSRFPPSGDQPQAIARLVQGFEAGHSHQILKGVTGSGKTYTMASLIARLKRPTLILAHNKTLAAQLYEEMLGFFPDNAVHFFVSYYDYYQPEVYLPASDTFIRKDASVNARLERLRLATTKALIERPDVVVIASVSSIYGLGDPNQYRAMQIHLEPQQKLEPESLFSQLARLQYQRSDKKISPATYRADARGIDIFPADSDHDAIRLQIENDTLVSLQRLEPASDTLLGPLSEYRVSPKTLYAVPQDRIQQALPAIESELIDRLNALRAQHQFTEAGRLEERVRLDLEDMAQQGYCSGMENYTRYLNERDPNRPPTTLLDYLPKNGVLMIDESHVMVPQIGAMQRGDAARKQTLIDYGFRLPSSLDNRPLTFAEFESIKPQTLFVSATPGEYELRRSVTEPVEQIIRPTGLLDPVVEVRPKGDQMTDVQNEIRRRIAHDRRTLITTLTKASAEALTEQLKQAGIKAHYLHSDIVTADRVAILKDLRRGVYDVLIGINLLREGLDLPEVSLVAIFDADKAGFLRSEAALLQTIGRAARNADGMAILYGDKTTDAMQQAIDQTRERRTRQQRYNQTNGITPQTPSRKILDDDEMLAPNPHEQPLMAPAQCQNLHQLCDQIRQVETRMLEAIAQGDEREAALRRAQLIEHYRTMIHL
ncbi:excinuclease ABC, B subunit [Ferrimonas balearica DSM 9799]|uniref:Excinuclease ABC, B subunit n=1 Tax=Ferrimonas balearica (strain DSM 9799 / CCM 4581 / KCTC 23876 / PAT) TaxID=550540 RepID=E1SLZ5_FERBD|nr:excinuclease ABC subunit UvrB [Ferrimonas balearica]ADN75527.1 excinuclease ABC, B subunit [Ferrimonas balearica DSM 9799]